MSVSAGDKITADQINELIDTLNSEASRRGYSGRVDHVAQDDPISYDAINAINQNRIETAKIYRATALHGDIKSCTQRSDKTGTPATWDGRDLTTTIINTGEESLGVGKRAYASQYNTLETDINNMANMCACDSYRKTRVWGFLWCDCNKICTEFPK